MVEGMVEGDIEKSCVDISKISMMLGFKPRYSLETGLLKYLKRYHLREVSGVTS